MSERCGGPRSISSTSRGLAPWPPQAQIDHLFPDRPLALAALVDHPVLMLDALIPDHVQHAFLKVVLPVLREAAAAGRVLDVGALPWRAVTNGASVRDLARPRPFDGEPFLVLRDWELGIS